MYREDYVKAGRVTYCAGRQAQAKCNGYFDRGQKSPAQGRMTVCCKASRG